MLRIATANLLIAVLFGSPLFCLAESAVMLGESATGEPCISEAADECDCDTATDGSVPCDHAPCDHDTCPDSDCICAGAVVNISDDVASEGDEQVVWLDVKLIAEGGALVASLPEFRLLPNGLISPDAQRRCALIGAFLL